jgi:hypothetical protein
MHAVYVHSVVVHRIGGTRVRTLCFLRAGEGALEYLLAFLRGPYCPHAVSLLVLTFMGTARNIDAFRMHRLHNKFILSRKTRHS